MQSNSTVWQREAVNGSTLAIRRSAFPTVRQTRALFPTVFWFNPPGANQVWEASPVRGNTAQVQAASWRSPIGDLEKLN